jgi:type I restriction enzyme S subunit
MSAYRPYPKTKSSGVEWLGEVPEHWEPIRFKNVFREKGFKSGAYLQAGSISFGHVVFKDDKALNEATKATYQEVLRGEFLINPINLNYDLKSLRTALSEIDTCVSPAYIVLQARIDLDRRYMKHQLSVFDVRHMKTLGAGVRQTISFSEIGDCFTQQPPLPEQIQIAAFLDRECGKLDALQAKQERLIELLKEKRQALISHAVTRGLDPTAKLKPSGIEWLGEVPEGWVVPYFGMLIAKAELGGNYDGSYGGDGIPLIKMGNLDRGFIKTNKIEYLPEGQAYDRAFILKDGDFLFNTRNSLDLVGKVAVWRSELPLAIYNSNILRIAFRKQKVADSAFMSYFFNSDLGVSQLRLVAKGTTSVAAIYYKDLTTLRIPLPPLVEQRAIVAHLDEKCGKIDRLMAKAERGIELLKERRSALISAAVTGKIDVRDHSN